MSNELAIIEEKNALAVFTSEEGLEPIIKKIREQVEAEQIDPSTDAGRKAIGSLARKIGSSKVQLKKLGQTLTEDWRAKTKAVTAETTRMEKEMDEMRDEVLAPRDAYEARIAERKQEFETRLNALEDADLFEFPNPDFDLISERITLLDEGYIYEWEEFATRAKQHYDSSVLKLQFLLKDRKIRDEQQAELKRLQYEEAERNAKAERERIANEAAAKATKDAVDKANQERIIAEQKATAERKAIEAKALEAENARIATERKAEQDKINAENARIEAERKAKQEKVEAVAAEQKRQADEKAVSDAKIAEQKQINDERAADVEHRKRINMSAKGALIELAGLTSEQAEKVVSSIAKLHIPSVTINY